MTNNGDAAETVVRVMLTGTEITLRLTASAAKICWRCPWRWQSSTSRSPAKPE